MAIELKMPALSPTMEKGNLAKWLVKVGDRVAKGDLIAEIETDKATMEVEADVDGSVAQLLVEAGTESVPVGTVIALISDGYVATSSAPAEAPEIQAASPSKANVVSAPVSSSELAFAGPPSSPAKRPIDSKIRATPLAHRLANAKGIDLTRISGSGARGRILTADLEIVPSEKISIRPAMSAMVAASPAPNYPEPVGVPFTTERMSSKRKTIARRLTEAKQNVPHFYLSMDCRIEELLALRSKMNAELKDFGISLSINDFLTKALALALVEVPDAHVQYGGDSIYRFERVDVSIAVALDDGLVTPIIRDVGTLSLSKISAQTKSLANQAREGKLRPDQFDGGTVTLSNLGMFGIQNIFPIINPPQALILGVGAGSLRPMEANGELVLANALTATASFDHRVIDGAVGAKFMAAFKRLVEKPLRLVM